MKEKIIYLILGIMVATSCINTPESCFSLNKTNVQIGDTIFTSNCSVDDKFEYQVFYTDSFYLDKYNRAGGNLVIESDTTYTRTGRSSSFCGSDDPNSIFIFHKPGKYYLVQNARNYKGNCSENGGASKTASSYYEIIIEL